MTPAGQGEDIEDPDLPPCLHGALYWVTGDVQYINDYLERWPVLSPVLPLRVINAVLRTLGAPVLVNNPFSGVLVLIALLIEVPFVVIWGMCGLMIAMVTAVLLHQPHHIVSNGQVTQHGLLLGLLVGHAMHTHALGSGHGSGVGRSDVRFGSRTVSMVPAAVMMAVTAAVR